MMTRLEMIWREHSLEGFPMLLTALSNKPTKQQAISP
jgi:hypothetical protein